MYRCTALFLLSSLVIVDAAFADFNAGLKAYKSGDFSTAFREWATVADQGGAHAQYNVGLMYAKGQGVGQDYAKAAEYYRKAAEQGCEMAEYNLGVLYSTGQGVPKDEAQALQFFKKAAEKGDFNAANNLATIYDEKKDPAQALEWVRKAADSGNPDALFQMGLLYDLGKGVPQDYAEALKWYEKAAEKGVAGAICNIAILYYNGEGVKVDRVEAHRYFLIARDLGEPRAANLIKLTEERLNRKQAEHALGLANDWRAQHPVKPSQGLIPPDERIEGQNDSSSSPTAPKVTNPTPVSLLVSPGNE